MFGLSATAALAVGVTAGAVGGAIISGNAAKGAAQTQADGANQATAAQSAQYQQTRQDMMPWLDAGKSALAQEQQLNKGDFSSFFASPDYNFTRSEGMRGLQQTASARGGAFSGNAMKALTDYNQNLASQQYGQFYNRIAGIAGNGQQTGNQIGVLGQNQAQLAGQNAMYAGDARASGIVGSANGWTNAIGGVSNYFGQNYGPNALNIQSYNPPSGGYPSGFFNTPFPG